MPDLLVKLYDLEIENIQKEYYEKEYKIVRALSPDKEKVIDFIKNEFNPNWASECERSFSNDKITCFIAVKEKKVIGFACYDATAKGFFGPTGVKESERKKGYGKKLLLSCLKDMWDNEYGYAIIGWTTKNAMDFYINNVSAMVIENSSPGIYKRMIEI